MIDYDLHIHTAYCGHAPEMTVEAICSAAEEKGLRLIGISDHIYEPANRAVIETIRREAAALNPACRVLVGAEIDVDAEFADGRLVTGAVDGLDYVIAGFHYVPTMGHYAHTPDQRKMDLDAFLKVWESSLLGIVSNPAITTLAHPGRMLATSTELETTFEHGLAVFEKAARLSAQNHIAWELNELTGQRIAPFWQEQWYRIYEIALDAGVKLVYGSDAHTPDSVGSQTFVQRILTKLPPDCLSTPEEILGGIKC